MYAARLVLETEKKTEMMRSAKTLGVLAGATLVAVPFHEVLNQLLSGRPVGLTPSQLDMEWRPHLNGSFRTGQECRLTCRHPFFVCQRLQDDVVEEIVHHFAIATTICGQRSEVRPRWPWARHRQSRVQRNRTPRCNSR